LRIENANALTLFLPPKPFNLRFLSRLLRQIHTLGSLASFRRVARIGEGG
jgi:hypothetical protein